MTLIQSILVALVQGLTEFLPVSSSGHMVLVETFLGAHTDGVLWEVALHVGTLLAVFAVFRRDLRMVIVEFCSGLGRLVGKGSAADVWKDKPGFRMGCYIIIGTIPAAVIGLTLRDSIERFFSQPILAAIMIFVTGEILWLTRPHALARPSGKMALGDGIFVGIAQALALVPGISRSGITISAGLARGIDRAQAARFSFLLAIPAILGGALLEARKLRTIPSEHITPMIVGILVAAVSGYLALRFLLRVVNAGKLHLFAYYCWAVGIAGVIILWGMQATGP